MFKMKSTWVGNGVLALLIASAGLYGKRPESRSALPVGWPDRLQKPLILEHTHWDGNLISTIHGNHGDIVSYHLTGNSGLEWPKGSGKTASFQSGIWMASGKVRGPGATEWTEELRTAAAEYTVEYVPGILGADQGDNKYRIYEIFKAERDAFLAGETEAAFDHDHDGIETTISLPTPDWVDWPVEDGAPWVDVDGDGDYDFTIDYPAILGDQFHWYVMNDGEEAGHTGLWATKPMNVEIQTSLFGFSASGPLENILFVRWVIINKGTEELDSVFVSMWHDDDVGDANDDLVASDTSLSLGWTFNAGTDAVYGVEVPATGGDFFQGPTVESPGDTATIFTWSLEKGYYLKHIPNQKVLPLTSFAKYIRGDDTWGDPETAEEAYRYMNGRRGSDGAPFVNTITGEETKFAYEVHSGDPIAETGWIDLTDHPPGDRRFLMSSGPFYMAPGDTHEVVGSIIVGGGVDAKKSIIVLNFYDKFAQTAFDGLFEVCGPPNPQVDVALLDEEIVLSWEDKSEDLENYSCLGYEFQGYNIFQGESPSGPWQRITTYDIVDEVKVIVDESLDPSTGLLLQKPVQFGNDTGIAHHIEITKDQIRNLGLINNRKYYFAVTAYAYDEEAAPKTVESSRVPLTVVPGLPGLGSDLGSGYADTLTVTHDSGIADARIMPAVVDPYQLTNDDYELFFTAVDSINAWHLVNVTDDDTLFTNVTEFPEESVTITDGFILTFKNTTFKAAEGYSSWEQTVDGDDNSLTQVAYQADNGTWAGFLEENGLEGGTSDLSDLQKDIRFVFTDEPQKGYYWNGASPALEVRDVPFEVWTVEDDVRINVLVWVLTAGKDVIHYEDKLVDPATGDSLTVGRFWNHAVAPIYEPYSTTASYAAFEEGSENVGWNMALSSAQSAFVPGDELVVRYNNPVFPGIDKFSFSTKGLTIATVDAVKSQLEMVNVFPNPYFAKNEEEIDPLGRFVTFTHLGKGTHVVRIFSLAGDLVAKIEQSNLAENDPSNLIRWDLRNVAGIPVASGIYIALVQSETDKGKYEKVLKLAVFQPEERLDLY